MIMEEAIIKVIKHKIHAWADNIDIDSKGIWLRTFWQYTEKQIRCLHSLEDKLPKICLQEVDNLNNSNSIKAFEFVVKKNLRNKILVLLNFMKHLRKN